MQWRNITVQEGELDSRLCSLADTERFSNTARPEHHINSPCTVFPGYSMDKNIPLLGTSIYNSHLWKAIVASLRAEVFRIERRFGRCFGAAEPAPHWRRL